MPESETTVKVLTHEDRMRRRKRIAVYCRTHTVAQACERFGVAETLVLAACRAAAVRPRRALLATTNLKLVGLLVTTDASYSDLATKFGVSRQAVHNLATRCKAAGIPVKGRA